MKVAVLAFACAILISSGLAQPPASSPPGQSPPSPPPPPPPPSSSTPPTSSPPTASPPTPAATARPPTSPPSASPPTPAATARPPTSPPSASPPTTATPTPTPARASPPSPGTTSTPTPTPARASPPPPGTTGGGGTTGGSTSSTTSTTTPAAARTPTDADILYFAYNLEVFEAQFYSCAAFGTPINAALLGGGPQVTCTRANLTSNVATYAAELAREETAHVALLQTALRAVGVNVVAPQLDITTAFTRAATAANSNLSGFNAYANDIFFLHAAFLFEDLGVSAYLGALNSISNSSYRLTGAQIGAAEAYHSGLIRTLLYQVIDTTPVPGFTVRAITDAIVAALNSLSGSPQLKYQLYNQQGASISNVDSNGLVPGASAQQVLRVVTLGANAGSGGGFFPNNLNGNVRN